MDSRISPWINFRFLLFLWEDICIKIKFVLRRMSASFSFFRICTLCFQRSGFNGSAHLEGRQQNRILIIHREKEFNKMDITKKIDQRSVLGWSFLELGTGSISIIRRHGWHGIFNGRLQYTFLFLSTARWHGVRTWFL